MEGGFKSRSNSKSNGHEDQQIDNSSLSHWEKGSALRLFRDMQRKQNKVSNAKTLLPGQSDKKSVKSAKNVSNVSQVSLRPR